MSPDDAFTVFDSLSEKHHVTLKLAASHLTSKEIALELGVAPVTIDKRIESVRKQLGSLARPELLRLYSAWCHTYDQAIDQPIILGEPARSGQSSEPLRDGMAYSFEDSITFDARSPWDRHPTWRRPGLKPSDLGISGKLIVMLIGAVAIMMVAVLSIAFAQALMSIFSR